MTKVIKRDGSEVDFNKDKIEKAITKAMKHGSGIIDRNVASGIAHIIEKKCRDKREVTIKDIENMVFDLLIDNNNRLTAKAYEGYRKTREFQRQKGLVDSEILGIVDGSNKETLEENSNKDAYVLPTQRDLIAGEVSKDLTRRTKLPTNLVQAHDEGIIHFHDADYFIQKMFNCCLVNLKDMLTNGTVINKKLIEPPRSFRTACTVATQIVQQIANGQYGGQTISLSHLAPFVRISYEKEYNKLKKRFGKRLYKENYENYVAKYTDKYGIGYKDMIRDIARGILTKEMSVLAKIEADERIKEEIRDGIQTIQYQINTFSTSNGQAPFLSIFMYLNEDLEYIAETSKLIEETLRQRYLGMKNEVGVYITPSFPKLLYVLDENNIHKDSKYRYLTNLAIKTVSKRMMPDFISAKKMKENYGDVFPCMGCRSFLSPYQDENGKNKWYGRFNQGVVTLNLADIGLTANKDMDKFWSILDERLKLCYDALILRHESLEGVLSDVSPIHWQHGGIARLKKGETIDKFLHNGYSTISLGYIGLYECVLSMLDESNTSDKGQQFALGIMNKLREVCDKWKAETGLGFGVYGSPSESTTYKLARKLRERFGVIEGITDKDYLTNSYHVNVKEEIDAFSKLSFEAQFQKISSGGSVSYVEVSNLNNNLEALSKVIEHMYETIQYAEINTKSDYCQECGFDGEILLDDNYEWYCPNCENRDEGRLNVCRRTCGYLGDNFWNKGRTQDIGDRHVHLDNHIYKGE